MTLVSFADRLERGVDCDIWYDAEAFGDADAADRIADAQAAMLEAAQLIRACTCNKEKQDA